MHRIILARLNFYGMSTHCDMVVNQIVDLALFAIVVIEELMTMGAQLLSNDTLINTSKINTAHVIKYRADIVMI